MKFMAQHDPPRLVLTPNRAGDAELLEREFGLRKDGDSISLVREDVLDEPDDDGLRRLRGFMLATRPVLPKPAPAVGEGEADDE